MTRITAPRTEAAAAALLDPAATAWDAAPVATLAMAPTPLGYQPSVYVVASWRERPYGGLSELNVQALHTGRELAVRLDWHEDGPISKPHDLDVFTDAAGILFPLGGPDTPIDSMGAPEKPVNAWYWRPNLEDALSAIGKGAGTVARLTNGGVHARGEWHDSRWGVVFLRAFAAREGVSMSAPGTVQASFAVWRGANQERAGIKAYAQSWHEISLEG